MKGFHTLLFGNSPMDPGTRYDAIIVGGGHNGLTAAAYLAKAGKSVLVLERRTETSYKVGEATVVLRSQERLDIGIQGLRLGIQRLRRLQQFLTHRVG